MEPEYARQYRDLYMKHWWWRAREDAVLHVLRRRVRPKVGLRILDVGCGDGLFFDRLAEFGDVEGIEPDEGLVDPQGPYRARICTAPFDPHFRPAQPYSLVLMLDVLEHLDNPDQALRHAYRLLEPEGALLITVPAFQLLWTNHDVINHHRLRYRRQTLRPLLHKAGFTAAEEQYWFQWTCPVKLAVRLIEQAFRRPPALPHIPSRWVNGALYSISRIEQRTLSQMGVPFGSTLMVFCQKQRAGESV